MVASPNSQARSACSTVYNPSPQLHYRWSKFFVSGESWEPPKCLIWTLQYKQLGRGCTEFRKMVGVSEFVKITSMTGYMHMIEFSATATYICISLIRLLKSQCKSATRDEICFHGNRKNRDGAQRNKSRICKLTSGNALSCDDDINF